MPIERRPKAKNRKNPDKFQCQLCTSEYFYKHALQYHIARNHVEAKQCDFCKKLIETPAHMEQHIKLEHKYNQLYSCNICGEFKSGSLFDISTHKWIVHQDWTFEAKTASPEKVTIKSEKDIKQEPKTSETKDEIVPSVSQPQSATIKVAMEIKEELPDDSIDLEDPLAI